MKDKNDFNNILNKLRNEFKANRVSTNNFNFQIGNDYANTRVIVIEWYIKLFSSFGPELIDHN